MKIEEGKQEDSKNRNEYNNDGNDNYTETTKAVPTQSIGISTTRRCGTRRLISAKRRATAGNG